MCMSTLVWQSVKDLCNKHIVTYSIDVKSYCELPSHTHAQHCRNFQRWVGYNCSCARYCTWTLSGFSLSFQHTLFPPAVLTLLPPLHSTALLNAAILAPLGPMIELWSPPGHINTTRSVMKLWIFHRSSDTNCLFAVHPLCAMLFSTVHVQWRDFPNNNSSLLFFLSGNCFSTGWHYTKSQMSYWQAFNRC